MKAAEFEGVKRLRVWTGGLLLTALACGGEGEIEQPTPLYGDIPIEYPLQLWDQDMEGETLLRVRVSDVGGVDSVEIAESSGYAAFDSAAVEGARDLRFEPARRNGKRIEVWATVPVHFSKRPRPDTARILPITAS
ncbi:MAG: energy transducer TonB [Gemmatimonadales bacterium]|nr:energy transducer TonB [Gemmatimonadales bacterium]MDG2239248.1 energy transducer TonB [Longimicrobiales bacterium]NCG31538.1 TonB family protein [Pseudomonadota bacterium]MBT3497681.1 energy transducer TonB [Gemmatimonadales bacterium]MBT3774738.1 energy transducer TonB [Gemmatimonadales bacterium]